MGKSRKKYTQIMRNDLIFMNLWYVQNYFCTKLLLSRDSKNKINQYSPRFLNTAMKEISMISSSMHLTCKGALDLITNGAKLVDFQLFFIICKIY